MKKRLGIYGILLINSLQLYAFYGGGFTPSYNHGGSGFITPSRVAPVGFRSGDQSWRYDERHNQHSCRVKFVRSTDQSCNCRPKKQRSS
jgi:hypothetical protein